MSQWTPSREPNGPRSSESQPGEQVLHLVLNEIADRAKLAWRQLGGIGNVPLLAEARRNGRAVIARAHRDDGIVIAGGEIVNRLGSVLAEVVIQLVHEEDGARVNTTGGVSAGAERLDPVAAVNPGERLGHLAAGAV